MTDILNSRNAIQAALKKRVLALDIPELGTIYIRRLSGLDTARLGDIWKGASDRSIEENEKAIQCRIAQLSVVDENGERIFGESDLDMIGQLDRDILELIQREVLEFSGMTQAAKREAEKNSESAPASSSPSNSRVN